SSYVKQSPAALSMGAGEQTTLRCTLTDSGYTRMCWYRQQPNRVLEALFTSAIEGDAQKYTTESFEPKRSSTTLFTLELSAASPSHTAVYYCACNDTKLGGAYFGGGTKLVVLEHAIKAPEVVVFDPSPEEIKTKQRATVVCLVTNFYPDNIEIRWSVDGKEKQSNDASIHTDLKSIAAEGNKTYSISSRLRFEAKDWVNSKKIECHVDHYQNGSVANKYSATSTITSAICGISKEEKIQSTTTAKLTYLILICKSILYALFVSIIAWKSKASYSKRFD
uniref:T cell receptor beta chain MC.7.G5-like n=1 Tax=Pristiophorus japonicus TaxID=55135 RepID=UPI00398E81D7